MGWGAALVGPLAHCRDSSPERLAHCSQMHYIMDMEMHTPVTTPQGTGTIVGVGTVYIDGVPAPSITVAIPGVGRIGFTGNATYGVNPVG